MMFAGIDLQSSVNRGALGAEARGMDGASDRFLAVPGSPRMSSGRRLRADFAATASAARIWCGADQSSSSSGGASFSETGASSPEARRRSALAAHASSSRSGATGARKIGGSGPHRLDGDGDLVAVRENDDRQVVAVSAQRQDQFRPLNRIPAAENRRLDFAAVRALQEGNRELRISSANDAPACASGNGRDQTALVRIGIQEQKGACRFFAHFGPFGSRPLRVDR